MDFAPSYAYVEAKTSRRVTLLGYLVPKMLLGGNDYNHNEGYVPQGGVLVTNRTYTHSL